METRGQMSFLNPDDYKTQKVLDRLTSLDLSGKMETSSRSKAKEAAGKMLDVLQPYVKRVISKMLDIGAADVKRLLDGTIISEPERQGNVSGEAYNHAAMNSVCLTHPQKHLLKKGFYMLQRPDVVALRGSGSKVVLPS